MSIKKGRLPKLEKILFIPDMHVPYQDKRALDLVLKVGETFKPDHVIILGDMIDFYTVSSYSKDPNRALKLELEVNETKKELHRIKALGAKNNVFVAGNHEDRLTRYLQEKAPELFNIISIQSILELDKIGFEYIPYKEHYKLGKLYITHDCGNAGRYAAHKALDTFQHNVVIGHTHRLCYMVEGNASGEAHLGAMFGWLGDVAQVDYMHSIKAKRDWAMGFGVGYLDPVSGFTYVVPVPMVDYSVVVEGKLFRG